MNKQYLRFVYDDVKSEDMGVIQASSSSGLFDEELTSNSTIKLEKVGEDRFHFFGIDRDVITFELTVYFKHESLDRYNKMIRWIKQETPKIFYFQSNPSRRLICCPEGKLKIEHNGNLEGFLTVTMKSNSPYYYSPLYETGIIYTNTGFTNTKSISIRNDGEYETDLYIKIDTTNTLSSGKFQISNYLQTFKIVTLEKGFIYDIDSENGDILKNDERVFNLNIDAKSEFITLRPKTTNYLAFNTDYPCKVNIYYQFKYKI